MEASCDETHLSTSFLVSISKVTITRDPPTRPLHNGNNLTLICTVILDTTVDTGVYVVAGWNGLGNMRYGTRPIMVSEGIYQSVAIFDSLQTSDSGNYICTASAHPSRRSKYIRKSEDVCNDINIFVGMFIGAHLYTVSGACIMMYVPSLLQILL